MGGVDGGEGEQVARDIMTELVLGCIPKIQAGLVRDPDLLARLYLLRDIATNAPELGHSRAAVVKWINRAGMLVRDEADHEQALRLLRRAAAQLAATVEAGPLRHRT